MKSRVELIADERKRQVEVEKWTAEHDKQHWDGSLAKAAACYALHTTTFERHFGTENNFVKLKFDFWPWHPKWWKPAKNPHSNQARIKNLVKAGALIAAEIDRLQM
jgi:hypothetical protein